MICSGGHLTRRPDMVSKYLAAYIVASQDLLSNLSSLCRADWIVSRVNQRIWASLQLDKQSKETIFKDRRQRLLLRPAVSLYKT